MTNTINIFCGYQNIDTQDGSCLLDLLKEFKANGDAVNLIVSTHYTQPSYYKDVLSEKGYPDLFDHIITDRTFKISIYNQEYWECVKEKIPFTENKTILIHHNYLNLLTTAQKVGIQTIESSYNPQKNAETLMAKYTQLKNG